jgi:hypothetical protein
MVKRLVFGTALLFLAHGCVSEETDSGENRGATGGSAGTNASGGSAQGGDSSGTGGEGASGGDAGSAGVDGGSAGSAGADGGSAGQGGSPCPDEKPELGESCGEHRRCFYPSASESCPSVCAGECGDALYCNQGNWILGEDRIPGCGAADSDCPANVPENFVLCPREGLECRYARTLCQCTPCSGSHGSGGAPPDEQLGWFCTEPDPGCPAILPVDGASCEGSEEDACSYGACFDCGPFGSHPVTQCVDGVWVEGHGDCQP